MQVVGVDQRSVEVEEERGRRRHASARRWRGGRRAGVVGGGADAAEREEVDARDRRRRVRGLVGGELGEEARRVEGEHEPGQVGGAALQHAQDRAGAAGHGVAEQRLQLGGAGDADVERQVMPAARRRSAQAMTGAASKTNWVTTAISASVSPAKPALRAGRPWRSVSPPSGSMSRLPSGWPATCRRVKPAGVEAAGARSCIASEKGPCGRVDAAGEDEGLGDADVGIGGEAAVELGAVGDAAGGDVRHDGEALVDQAAGGRHHVGEGGAVDVGDVDPGAGGQEGAEVVDLGGGPRHDLDREVLGQRRRASAPPWRRRRRCGGRNRGFSPSGCSGRVRVSGWPSRRWRSGP